VQRGMHAGFFEILEARLGREALRRDREDFDRCVQEADTLLLRRVCDRLGTWIQLGALVGIDEPGIRARAELSASRHLASYAVPKGYAALIDRCTS